MNERNLTVIGSYSTREEALTVIEQLRDEGYNRDDIVIYATEDTANNLGFRGLSGIDVETEANPTGEPKEERSLWDRIKDAFSFDTYDYDMSNKDEAYSADNDPLYQYRDDIAAGNIVITVKDYRQTETADTRTTGILNTQNPEEATGTMEPMDTTPEPTSNTQAGTNDETIQLKEEQLDVNTHDVTTGEVDIHKHVVNDTETVEVPVKREEIVIERKPVNPSANGGETTESLEDETITIPIKEEQIDVNKHTVVREEVDIRKEEHEDTKQVTEDVSREELDIDTSGDVHVEDKNNPNDRKI
ncbi:MULTISPECIES: DUF2382 domain-containing protein [unclassified Enterococcus]|uniref:DUF2382 domain-containing protein n=1 Tax=unclassified Enterococcus TaxID=2608891 RepID=UPI0013ED8790|nr:MULTISPECIES: DUF2382 domain-containing protein [unclassified Enterococcus]